MDKRKHIWIVNFHTAPPEYISQPRYIKLVPYLQAEGYKVTIITQSYLRKLNIEFVDKDKKFSIRKYDNIDFIHIKSIKYKGNGIGRMFSIFMFSIRLYFLRNRFEKPDIIIHNIHAPFDYPVLWCSKKLKSKYIVEAWDLWPEGFVRFGIISKRNLFLKFAYIAERKMYENAKKIIFTFEGGIDYLRRKHWTNKTGGKIEEEKVHYINNGISIEDFNNNKTKFKLNDEDIESPNTFKIIYMGSINLVNDVIQLIDAVDLLKEKEDIKLYIYGDGSQREDLIDYCKEKSITNVVFKEKRIPLTYVPYVLSNASLNVLNYQKGFGEYGISSGKFFQSLGSGKPIICNIKINYDLISKNNLGICDDLNSSEKYAEAILKIYNLKESEYKSMCERVIETAKQFDYSALSKELINILESV